MTQHTNRYKFYRWVLQASLYSAGRIEEWSLSARVVALTSGALASRAAVQTPGRSQNVTVYTPLLIAKVLDPVFFDDGEAQWFSPFTLRDLGVSYEIETYDHLMSLQGTEVPRFYGHLAAPPRTQGRTANVILPEQAPGTDLRTHVPDEVAEYASSMRERS